MSDFSRRVLMIIPSINGARHLERMLPSLRFAASSVVVLDQGSTDDTDAICAAAGVEIVQLGVPHTYTQASNIGADLARRRGAEFVCIANNDIVFTTDVMAELIAEMDRDPRLGVVAPSQIIMDASLSDYPVSYRVYWNLDRVEFFHQFEPGEPGTRRLEADFCEFTCALVRLSAIDTIGFLDDEYGFYHEDADFGLRLRKAGYGCAYLPQSQIYHYSGSTFALDKQSRKAAYIARNKLYFAQKHLGIGVDHADPDTDLPLGAPRSSEGRFHVCLSRFGLIDRKAPELVSAFPGAETSGYLLTSCDAARVPEHWAAWRDQYAGVFVPSASSRERFAEAGFRNCFQIPTGIEPDIFSPWGPASRLFDETTYLAVIEGSRHRSLKTILAAWRQFIASGAAARLVLLGEHLTGCMGRAPDTSYRSGPFTVSTFAAEGVDFYETQHMPTAADLARIYRGVDYSIVASAGDSALRPILESLACGIPCLCPSTGPAGELSFANDLSFGLNDDLSLAILLGRSFALSDCDRKVIGQAGYYHTLASHTVRHTMMALHRTLPELQQRDASRVIESVRRREPMAQAIALNGETGLRKATMAKRMANLTARRMQTIGSMTSRLGAHWEENGFKSAFRASYARLDASVRLRSKGISHMRERTIESVRMRLRKASNNDRRSEPTIADSTLLIGYIDAQLGLGESLRGLALALSDAGQTFSIYPFGIGVEGRRGAPYMPERYDTVRAHAINVIEVTPDELPRVLSSVSAPHFDNSYTILRTYWELGRAPEVWRAKLAGIQEIWAPNSFVADSFRTIFDGPITIVPPCVLLPEIDGDVRDSFGLLAGRYYFMFSFDYYSFPQRKNPLGVIRAFRKAFPDPSANVGLIVKSTGAESHFPEIKSALLSAARQDPRIRIIDRSLTRAEMLSLIKTSDCYASLHRAEGFGLGMAEAMAMGKVVIGTDYSGNTEFLREDTGFPVPFSLRPVGAGNYVYPEGQVWAEPDENECAAIMTRVWAEPDEAARRALAGQAFIQQRYSPRSVGRVARERLHEIYAQKAS